MVVRLAATAGEAEVVVTGMPAMAQEVPVEMAAGRSADRGARAVRMVRGVPTERVEREEQPFPVRAEGAGLGVLETLMD